MKGNQENHRSLFALLPLGFSKRPFPFPSRVPALPESHAIEFPEQTGDASLCQAPCFPLSVI